MRCTTDNRYARSFCILLSACVGSGADVAWAQGTHSEIVARPGADVDIPSLVVEHTKKSPAVARSATLSGTKAYGILRSRTADLDVSVLKGTAMTPAPDSLRCRWVF